MENKGASLTKWPFVVANVMLVGLDLWMLKQLLPPHDNWDRVLAGLCLLVGAWAAWLHCRAWLVEYETRTRLQENEELKGAVEQISQLATRLAEQALSAGRAMSLEPMPPNERRIVHMALRDHPHVYTQSSGDGERRKVFIVPKS